MRGLRRNLNIVLFIWLAFQVSALAAPVVLAAAGATPVEEICTCPGGDHETCPMHHSQQGDQQGAAVCGVSAAGAPADVALLSMAGGAGVMPVALHVPASSCNSPVRVREFTPSDFAGPHSTPPPRL